MRLSGAADAVAVKMDQVLRGNDWLILGFSGAILFLVGMFVGIAGLAVLAMGVFVVPQLRRIGMLPDRSEEHTYELKSLLRISYAVFCLHKKLYEHTSLT